MSRSDVGAGMCLAFTVFGVPTKFGPFELHAMPGDFEFG